MTSSFDSSNATAWKPMIERFNIAPPNMFHRQVRGQFLFSPIVVVRGSDHAHIYVAGKTAIQPDGKIGGVGDLRTQIRLTCEAVRDSLLYVGATLDDVVRTVTYVLDIDAYYAVADERYKLFTNALPTNTLLAVSRLAHPDMQFELEAEAIVAPNRLKNLTNKPFGQQ
jgi:enamine deaminase RidA (YjgF/YER057c/UK114 family)